MSKAVTNDPKEGAQKVTNTDEQEVVVNHSTVQEGGYDEPVNQQDEQTPSVETKVPKKQPTPERQESGRPQRVGEPRKPRYHDEESE